MLEHLRESITSTYKNYEPDATATQVGMLFADKEFRSLTLARMETTHDTRTPSTIAYWHKYVERFSNYDRLRLDLLQTELLCAAIKSHKTPDVSIREYDIAANGDTILEFANSESERQPILRFRVLSCMLIESSQFFARILSPSHSDSNNPLEMLEGSPPPPTKQICRDGTEVKVYRMPQLELNKREALTTLLHAAHMHTDQIPREINFDEFVCIAEVCLRYQCTGPLEMAVEYRWLPQWIHKANEASPDGFLLIVYVFGLRRLFHRTSKSAILNIASDKELERKELWPREVKDKIGAVRAAKLAQIYASCASLMTEYLRAAPYMQTAKKDSESALTSTPKCSKGLHQCDAANLGWLMLVFNELDILPVVMDTVNGRYPFVQSGRSIKSLVQSLTRMPSAPQLHSGICDYAPAFRTAINDIYNSITGLTLRDVSGIDGWALTKMHNLRNRFSEDALREVFELPAPVEEKERKPVPPADETVSLRILSYLDDLQDLHATAMVNKSFYSAFKKHELILMRNLVIAGRRKTTEITGRNLNGTQEIYRDEQPVSPTGVTLFPIRRASTYRTPQLQHHTLQETANDDLYGITPPTSPFKPPSELRISSTEVEEIPWPYETANSNGEISLNGGFALDPERNEKFLSREIVHVDKSLIIEGRKHLRDEQDTHLRMGSLGVVQTS